MFKQKSNSIRNLLSPILVSMALVTSLSARADDGGSAVKPTLEKIPAGWIKAGSAPKAYSMGVDEKEKHNGSRSGFVASKGEQSDGFGTLMQMIDSKEYLGKRVRLSGWLKSDGVTGWSSIWMRVDGKNAKESLAFDNMMDRPVKGTTDWKDVKIVLDVPQEARAIAFGLMLIGSGKVWVDGLNLEIVPTTEPVTGGGKDGSSNLSSKPVNIDFEQD